MDTQTKIDITSWKRKEHFEFFSSFEEPYFGLTAKINCTKAYLNSKENGSSFFLNYLHNCLLAINNVPEFQYRIINNEVYQFSESHVSATINRPNETFGFSHIEYDPKFSIFKKNALVEIDRVRACSDLFPAVHKENVVHCSAIPWVDFTALTHSRAYSKNDSCPKISFGKAVKNNNEWELSVAVFVHHGLVDGRHVGQFFEAFQNYMNA